MTKRAKMVSVHDWVSEEHLWFSKAKWKRYPG